MNSVESLLDLVIQAPNGQIDHTVIPKIAALKTMGIQERPAAMKAILDECAYAALASDFAMVTMDVVWKVMQREAGQ